MTHEPRFVLKTIAKSESSRPTNLLKRGFLLLPENWREALRLCVAICADDVINDVVLAILRPLPREDAAQVARPRAVLAALCLADEPNVSETTAYTILQTFAKQVNSGDDGSDSFGTSVELAAQELASTRWVESLRLALVAEFCQRDAENRPYPEDPIVDVDPYGVKEAVERAMQVGGVD